MFNPFKKPAKHKTSTPETPEQKAMRDTALDKVLLGYQVEGKSLAQMIAKLKRTGEVVDLTLRLPEGVDAQHIHQQLGQQLQRHGIHELNMNVIVDAANTTANTSANTTTNELSHGQSEHGKAASSSLPKTTDAMPKTSSHSKPNPGSAQQASTVNKSVPTQADIAAHPRISHIVVVASGKGGVGKSTTTVNIALALQQLGKRVGVLDADIYGPSIPAMLGVAGVKPELENEQFVPVAAHGMPVLSIGSLLDTDSTPVAWRGPKATGALMQLYNQTNWPNLDYLLIDMPPGTGDIQLTLAQRIPVTGAVIVTTPQHIALLDAEKGIEMFNKTHIPVLGVVENMALHICSACGHAETIFGSGGGEAVAQQYQIPLLGQLPLASRIREQADNGIPSVIADDGAGDEFAHHYIDIAKNIDSRIAKFAKVDDSGRIF